MLIFLLHKPTLKPRAKSAFTLRLILLSASSASLLLSAMVSNKHVSFSYFLIPTRFWEIGLGCLAFLYTWRLPARYSHLISALGLGSICFSCFYFNGEIPYPGVAALLPTLGTLVLILGQEHEGSIIHGILSSRWLTYVGDISYALYLVHWPIIVFATAFFPAGLAFISKLAIACLSFVAASFLTFLIENPIRQKRFFVSRRSLFAFAAGSAGMIALISFLTIRLTPPPG